MGTVLGFALAPTGIDVGAGITAAITALAAIVTVAIGGYAAFLLVRRGLRWLGTALR